MNTYKRARRWLHDRCEQCGHRFAWKQGRFSFGNRDGKVYHEFCLGYLSWRSRACERLALLDLICDVYSVDERDVRITVELRAQGDDERVAQSNACFRVLNDLKKRRNAEQAA